MVKTNRMELLSTLNSVKPGLSNREVVEQSTSFVFQSGQVITYNDEIAIHAPLPEGFDLEGATPAKELLSILSRFKGEEVEIDLAENEIKLKCGRSRAGVRLEVTISLPLDELKIPKKWNKLPVDFIEGLKACIPSAARDMTYPILTTLHITPDYVESSDNNRITRFELSAGEIKNEMLLPVEAAIALTKISGLEKFAVNDGWAHFTDDSGMIMSCRVSEGDYPNLDQHLEIDAVGSIELPGTIHEMLDRAGVFLSSAIDQDNAVRIEVTDKGLMTVRGEGEFGWYEEACRVKWSGKEGIAFSVHPAHLAAILETSKTVQVAEGRIAFSDLKFKHVVALEAQ